MSRLGVAVMRWLALWPLPWLRALGALLGWLLYALALRRRRVGDINLALCFPQASPNERRQWLQAHFVAFAQAWLDRAWLWHASPAVVRQRLTWVGDASPIDAPEATVVFAPHFVGLDAGWTALCLRKS